MNFRRLVILIFCLIATSCAVPASVLAGDPVRFEELTVTDSSSKNVLVKIQSDMFQGRIFSVGGISYEERVWVDFFVRKLLVGRCGETVTKVVLRKPRHHDAHVKRLVCPPIFGEWQKNFYVSKSGEKLTIVCHDLDCTLYGEWYLNESGLAISRQYP